MTTEKELRRMEGALATSIKLASGIAEGLANDEIVKATQNVVNQAQAGDWVGALNAVAKLNMLVARAHAFHHQATQMTNIGRNMIEGGSVFTDGENSVTDLRMT